MSFYQNVYNITKYATSLQYKAPVSCYTGECHHLINEIPFVFTFKESRLRLQKCVIKRWISLDKALIRCSPASLEFH